MPANVAASAATSPTSLKLPNALKLQLEEDAQQMGMSLHAFMLNTLADAAQRKRLRQGFAQDAADALANMKATGKGHALDDVRAYFDQMKKHRQGQAKRPVALRHEKLG